LIYQEQTTGEDANIEKYAKKYLQKFVISIADYLKKGILIKIASRVL